MKRLPLKITNLILAAASLLVAALAYKKFSSSRAGKLLQAKSKKLRRRYLAPRVSLAKFHTAGLFLMSAAFVAGSYFTISEVLLPRIRALSESSLSMPTDVAFNRGEDGSLDGWDDGDGSSFALAEEVRIATSSAWWNPEFHYKKSLTLNNLTEVDLASGSATTAQITINTKALYDQEKLQDDCDDLRVVRVATDSAQRVELPRSIQTAAGATNCSDSTGTIVSFPMQRNVASGSADANYEVYYGGAEAEAPNLPRQTYLSFDGVDDYVLLENAAAGLTDITIEAWVKTSTAGTIISNRFDNGNAGAWFYLRAKYLSLGRVFINGGYTHKTYEFNSNTLDGKWHHIAYTKNGDTHTIYVDGEVDQIFDVPAEIGQDRNLMLGRQWTLNGANIMNGNIDDVRIWNTALDQEQIRSRMHYEVYQVDPLWSNLIANWKLNEGEGQEVFDSSSNGNDGTLGANTGTNIDDPVWITESSNASYSVGENLNKKATLVCPFNGTTTCAGGETPTTETGAIRYSGGKSALEFDGVDDTVHTQSLGGYTTTTYEAWVYVNSYKDDSGYRSILNSGNNTELRIYNAYGGEDRIQFVLNTGGAYHTVTQSDYIQLRTWTHVAAVYDGENIKLFINGVLKGSSPASGTTIISKTYLGSISGTSRFFDGKIDEVRISDTIRYTSNFTPSQTPFEPDEHTKLLLHFDENGSDPRFEGKAIDASGNGNHGTINGAKYVSGLVGVDSSPDDTGAVPSGSFASHQGIFIEEGTTNLITNPSFEHSATYNTNWGTNYENYNEDAATFTPGVAKRNGGGPFAQGVMVGGESVEGQANDKIQFPQNAFIGHNFTETFDKNQGSLVMWITPEWNGNDGNEYAFFTGRSQAVNALKKTADNKLMWDFGWNKYHAVDISDWIAGNTYLVIIRWDAHKSLDGSNYISITIDQQTSFGERDEINTFGSAAPSEDGIVGGCRDIHNCTNANAIIEGLTIYRRPLFDGEYGVDVGNGDELEQIYNGGAGKDPTLITGSWDVVFALPTNAQTGELTSGTGNAWSHPHSSNLLYTDSTNTGGFMMNGEYSSDGWSVANNTPIENLETSEKVFAGGYKIESKGFSEGVLENAIFENGTTSGWLAEGTGGIVSADIFTNSEYGFELNGYGGSRILQNNKLLSEGYYSMQVWYKHVEGDVPYFFSGSYSDTTTYEDFTAGTSGDWRIARISFFATEGQKHVPIRYANTLPDDRLNGITIIGGVLLEQGLEFTPVFNEGLKYTLSDQSIGRDYVVRAIAHSDGSSTPIIQIWDNINDHEITRLRGTPTSTRNDPDVLLFTFELPYTSRYEEQPGYEWVVQDSNQFEVRLISSESGGSTYWHQVEVYENRIDNPSMEVGSGDPWLASGWNNQSLNEGKSFQEIELVKSGYSSWAHHDNSSQWSNIRQNHTFGDTFVSFGSFARRRPSFRFSNFLLNSNGQELSRNDIDMGDLWKPYFRALKATASTQSVHLATGGHGFIASYDDTYIFPLTSVPLTVTPASEANSTESTGLRVDGSDTVTQPVDLSIGSGTVKFKYTPRHSFDIADQFGNLYPTILTLHSDDDNYIKLLRQDDTTLRLNAEFNGTVVNADWTSPTLNAGTTYTFEISYSSGGNLVLKVDGTQVASNSGVVDFANAPSTAYFGSDNTGGQQYDGTIAAFESLTDEENTSAPYTKFGSKSVKLTASATQNDEYVISIDPDSTSTHTLSAYVYSGTTGAIGGTVDGTVAELYYDGDTISTSYEDTGGGWWRLTGQLTPVDAAKNYGVQVKAGKTVYVDGVQLEQKSYATTYADGSLGDGYSWSGGEWESEGARDSGTLKYSANNTISTSEGTVSLWYRPNSSYPTGQNLGVNKLGLFTLSGGSGNLRTYFVTNGTGTWRYQTLYSNGGNNWSSDGGNNSLLRNEWDHIVVTWDASGVTTYRNDIAGTLNAVPIDYTGPTTLQLGFNSSSDYANGGLSDLRIFDSALTQEEVSQLYHSGLLTHTTGEESDDRYEVSGTYTSPTIDLGANGQWGSTPLTMNQTLNGGTVSYLTRTSQNNSNWSEWQSVGGSIESGSSELSIASPPYRYLQLKAEMSANEELSDSPVITGMTTTYVEDTTPPDNPDAVALGYSTNATQSADLVSGEWYNHPNPKFTWDSGEDNAAIGQSSSGVDGYHVLLTTDEEAVPAENTGDNCYLWADEEERVFTVGTTPANCELTDGTYLLKLQAKDFSGNTSDPVQIFTYKYDGTIPRAPLSISTTEVGYQAENTFTFFWPAAQDQGPSGVLGYEYKTGAQEGPFSEWQFTSDTSVSGIEAYQEGQNFFYVRTIDTAGNYSGETSNNVAAGSFYFNASAPTAPTNVAITPESSSDNPAGSNVFTVSWDKPASYSGEIAKYYYCVNCTPSESNMTETDASQTVERSLENMALATQQGKNTFYIVAEDNNINNQTGHGNRNFDAYASIDFFASTTAPGAPQNLTISDASNKEKETWRLTLAWEEPLTGGTPDHYEVFRSEDDGATYKQVGDTTSTAFTDANLSNTTKYFYKVKAIDDAGSSSIFSNVVSETPVGKYLTPPSAGGIPTVDVGSTTALVKWTTAREAYGTVEYGRESSYGSSSGGTTSTSNHEIKITGLTPGTTYHFRTQSLDESTLVGYDRDEARSSDYTFTTLKAAEISNVVVEETSLESAVITWQSSSLQSAVIEYGLTADYGSEISAGASADESTHTARLSGLEHSATYHFRIKAVDIDGTEIASDDYLFNTITFPEVTAVLFNTDQSGQGTSATIAWSTNVPTTGTVEYQPVSLDVDVLGDSDLIVNTPEGRQVNLGVLSGLSQAELASLPVTPSGETQVVFSGELERRRVQKITGLEDGSIYVFTLRGRDEHGNEAVSEPIRYVTGADTKPPTIQNLVIETPVVGVGADSRAQIVVSFETDEPAYTQIHWGRGTGSEYPQSTERSSEPTTQHVVVLRDLEPTSSYHMKIAATDISGNTAESEDTVVVTPTAQEAAFDIILRNLEGVFGFLSF